MATNETLKSKLENRKKSNGTAVVQNSLKYLLGSEKVRKEFQKVLKERTSQYIEGILSFVNIHDELRKCQPGTVIDSFLKAAKLELPVDINLGYAWIIPYKERAVLKIGYKGYIQLALRTSQYKSVNIIKIYEGELVSWNPLSEELSIDFGQKKSNAVIGYAGYFELLNGFRKSIYWSKEQVEDTRKKSNQGDIQWKDDYDAMAMKTVIKSILSKGGILSGQMQEAYAQDMNGETQIISSDSSEKIATDTKTAENESEKGA